VISVQGVAGGTSQKVAANEVSYALSTPAQNGAGAVQGPITGGNYGFSIAGTLGGDTATLSITVDGNTSVLDTFTGPTLSCYAIGNGATLQLTTSGTAHSGVVASLNALGACPLGGRITVADGADVTQGAKTDPAWNGTDAAASVVSVLKKMAGGTTTNGTTTLNSGTNFAGYTGAYCRYTATYATLTADGNGNVPLPCGITGTVGVSIFGGGGTQAVGTGVPADASANGGSGLTVVGRGTSYNGTSWDRERTLQATDMANGLGVKATGIVPTATPSQGVAGAASATVLGGRVLKNTAGNLFEAQVTTGASAGNFMLFDSATVPADGAVTPIKCVVVPANSTATLTYKPIPLSFVNGMSAVFSTPAGAAGCFTKTASATAFIQGDTK
jgi:hypothetical protein